MLKTGIFRYAILAAVVVFAPAVASAGTIVPPDIQTGDRIRLIKGTTPATVNGLLGGGPFQIDGPDVDVPNTNPTDFISFCLEYNEHVSWNTPYYVKLSPYAKNGGIAGGTLPNGDPLDSRTAFLYHQFLSGGLGGLYDPTDVNSKDGLQLAIWLIEQEVRRDWDGAKYVYKLNDGGNTVIGNTAKFAKADAFYAMTDGATGMYGMRVMQLWQNADFTGNKQDAIIYVPEGGTTFGSLMVGLVAIGAVRRRIRP